MHKDADHAPQQQSTPEQDMTSATSQMTTQPDISRTISMDLSGMHDSRRRSGWRKSREDSEAVTGDARKADDPQLGPVVDVHGDGSALKTDEETQEVTAPTTANLDTSADPVEMISPTPIRMAHSTILGQHPASRDDILHHSSAPDRPRSGSTSTTSSIILITSSPNPGAPYNQPSNGNGHSLGVPSRSPRPRPIATVPLSNPFERSPSPNPSLRSHSSQAFGPVSSRRSSFSFSLSMGAREKTPSPAPDAIDSTEGRHHGRKPSISRSIAGALISGWNNNPKDEAKVKRGKSPAPSGRKSMDWGSASDAAGNRGMTPSASAATITPDTRNPPSVVPPPVAAKPGWLRRTASGNKMLAGLGLGSSAGSSYSLAAASNRDLAGVAEAHDETPQTTRMGPPTLPDRKQQKQKENRAPALPPRKGHASQGSTSRLSIASALDFRRPKSPGRIPSTGSTASSVPEPKINLPPGPDPAFSKSYDETTVVSGLPTSQGLLPPPPQRAAQSMDVPRRVSPGSRHQPGSSALGSLSSVNALQGRPAQRSKPPESIPFPTSGSSSFLQAAPGAIGSAVSTGWAALRSTRSSMSFPHSSSGAFPRSGSTADSSWIREDGNGHEPSRTGLVYEGPKLSSEAVRRPPGREGGLAFGRRLEEAAEACPVEDTHWETGTEARRKRRKRCLPAVAIRCVDHLSIWAPQEEGIFRISGRTTHITQLRKQFDAGADIALELCDPGDVDPHAVASLYRSYLRELPSPILTEDVMPNFNRLIDGHKVGESPSSRHNRADLVNAQRRDDVTTHSEDLIMGMRTILESLSDSSWWLLNDLSRILALTSQHSQINKMTIQNLLTVFSPSLKISMTFLKLLVEHHERIFADEVPTLADRRGADKQLSLLPDLVITSHTDEHIASKANSVDVPAPTVDRAPSPAPSERARFSTPIADKFARTGPVIISFREPPQEQQ